MSISRDRLIRNEDLADVFLRRQRTVFTGEGGFDSFTPFRWGSISMTGADRITGLASVGNNGVEGVSGRGIIGGPINSRGSGFNRLVIGRENMSPAMGIGRAGRSVRGRRTTANVLPSWYPRRPLQDITSISRAMQARRARGREDEGLQLGSPVAQDQSVHNPITSTSGAQLEHDLSMHTPAPKVAKRHTLVTVRKLPKLLLDITNDDGGDTAFQTPQAKLLNSIEAVGKVLMEELQEWKSSPAAKKVERQHKIRTLMSMR